MLRMLGYDVDSVYDGDEALQVYSSSLAEGKPYGAVIMDLTIRGGRGGKEAIQELMKIDPDAKVIVSSGYSDDPVMSEFREYGFVGVVEKPYKIEDLSEVLDKVMVGDRG